MSLKGINSEVISEVRNRAQILDVISETVVLKRSGKAHKGLCPFHPEKTPSFYVNPDRGFYKCFGCGEGGDVFAFVQKVKGVNFVDSVRELAHKTGVQLVETVEDQQQHDRRSLFLMLYQQANAHYRRLLQDDREGAVARDYLKQRGVTQEIIDKFELGFAPANWDGLKSYLMQVNKVTPETLVEAGLIRRKNETDKYYDLFRNRLMIPIHDEQGRVIAFGGRTLADDQIKYLNSPESPIYTKGDHLFAFHLAREAIRSKDSVIVVEGYFDAITPHQYGFNNTVATLGTALTEKQAKLLVRYTESKRVFLCFDADLAGERAVDRGTETISSIAEGIGIELRVIKVPGSKDPDECLRSCDPNEAQTVFQKAIDEAPLLIDYRLDKAANAANLTTHTGRIQAAGLIVPILSGIKNAVARGEYIRQWCARLGIREEELLSDVAHYRRQNRLGVPMPDRFREAQARAAQKNAPRAGYIEAERELLALYLVSADDHQMVRDRLLSDTFLDAVHQRIKDAMEGVGKFTTAQDFQDTLMDRLGPDPDASKTLIDIILKAEEVQKQNPSRAVILKEARARIMQEKLNQEKNRLRAMLPQAKTDEEQMRLQSRIMQLKQLETQTLPFAQTEQDLDSLRQKIDSLLVGTDSD